MITPDQITQMTREELEDHCLEMSRLITNGVCSTTLTKKKGKPAWSNVAHTFGIGSTSAATLCVRCGVDPESGDVIKPA